MTTPDQLPGGDDVSGIAELVRLLTSGADLPGVVVLVDEDLGDTAAALEVDQCGHTPMLLCGSAWVEGSRLAMYGTIAHEVAHHALGHTRASARVLLPRLPCFALVAAAAALLGGHVWVAALILLAAPLARLVCLRRCRRHEREADAHAVTLLNAAGLPGTASLTAVLDGIAAAESRWNRTLGWLAATHPPVWARRRHLNAAVVPALPPGTTAATRPYAREEVHPCSP
ncbi:M48 family metalloprotease [Nonomuraea rubra]|uniref:M48 family metalloprotease n=1 Tax=Nonomuraea rubra TaxID=46180 RepID=UPI0033E1387B